MAIALTSFEAFCGFRPLFEISYFLQTIPEYSSLLFPNQQDLSEIISKLDSLSSSSTSNHSTSTEQEGKKILKEIFSRLMKSDSKKVEESLEKLVSRLSSDSDSHTNTNGTTNGNSSTIESQSEIKELILRLNTQYPSDIGIFCTFLLSHLRLKPGEAIFLGANQPHAYLSGDAVECMAASDNVVRAGLTPKLKDVDNLVEMLTYDYRDKEQRRMKAKQFNDDKVLNYDPPIDEFSVLRIELKNGKEKVGIRELEGPSILIVTKGNGKLRNQKEEKEFGLESGKVWFVGANTEVEFESGEEGLEVFRAFVEV